MQAKPAEDWEKHWADYDAAAQRNPANRYRRQLVFDAIATSGQGTVRLVDLGCGQGHLLHEARARIPGVELVGIDLSETGIELARARMPEARFVRADFATPIAVPEDLRGWATHIVCSEVIEHLDDPTVLLAGARPLLAPGGQLIITVPGGPRSAFDKHIGHRRHYSPRALGELAAASGYRPLVIAGAGFPFFNLYKLAIIARGQRLVRDLSADDRKPSPAASMAMRAFDGLFHFNVDRSRWGWQTFGVLVAA